MTLEGIGVFDEPLARAIFDSFPSGIVVQGMEGKIVAANPAAEKILGIALAQMLGVSSIDPGWRALHPDGSAFPGEGHPAMVALRSGQAVRDVVMGVFNPTTSAYTWINVNAIPVRHTATGCVQGVYSTFQDITRQEQAERALRDKDAEFRIAVQTSSDGFWIVDANGKILEANEAYCKQSGYSRDELLTLSIHDLDYLDKSGEVASRMQRIAQSGAGRFVSIHRTKDQRRWPVEVVASYSPTGGGRFYCFIKDQTEQQNSAELIWHQANFDRLTDLPGRSLFFDRLSQECSAARRNGKQVALLFADLDAFKPVNDLYGHDAGDVVLQTVASRWLSCVRGKDTVARLGGDEFAIILGNLDGPNEAAAIAAKVIESLQAEIALPHNLACSVGVSLGIAMYPTNAVEMDSLLSAADKAMYECKARGKNSFFLSDAVAGNLSNSADWMAFNDSHLVGVAEIDAQHRQMVRLVNDLNHDISAHAEQPHIDRLFDGLINFTIHHFHTEHRLMLEHHYPDTPAHDREHGKLTAELRQIIQKMGNEGDLLVLQKIKDWLVAHIRNSDKALGKFLNEKGVH